MSGCRLASILGLPAACGAHPSPSKVKVMSVASVLQGDSIKLRLKFWFVPPIVIPIMLAALIVGSGLYRAYW
jgi:hypothetical protein